MTTKEFVANLLMVVGGLSLFLAAVCLGLGLRESMTIPASQFKDQALGYVLAPPLGIAGLVLLGIGWVIRGKRRTSP